MGTIENIFCSSPSGVLSFVGGGGKTSLMFHLAGLLVRSGRSVLTTTTTKIFVPTAEQSETVLVDSDPRAVLKSAASRHNYSGHVTAAARHYEGGKLKGFAPEEMAVFKESGLFDWILVEADGAAGRPLKAPAEHEPSIPSLTTVLVSVAGLDVLGRPLSDQFVFRSRLVGGLMGLAEGETITESALAVFYSQPSGPFKGAPSGCRRFIFLNKADDSERRTAGERVAGQLRRTGTAAAEALIVGQAREHICVHSVHSLVTT